jgi:hypothetical protein
MSTRVGFPDITSTDSAVDSSIVTDFSRVSCAAMLLSFIP